MQRGNILEWEQPLVDRVKGVPVDVEVNMDPDSILYDAAAVRIDDCAGGRGIRCGDLAWPGTDTVARDNRHAGPA